jgi:hypothetical protein
MKKFLLIAYFYPPRLGIGGQRPSKLAKYLPKFGWEAVVLTAKLPGRSQITQRIIETNYKDVLASIKSAFGFDGEKGIQEQLNIQLSKDHNYSTWKSKLIKISRDLIAYPDPQKGWHKIALRSACELLAKQRFDVVISTSPPATSHMIARELKKSYRIPWVADLRDLWTQHQFYDKYDIIKYLEKRLELKTLSLADSLVTVTPDFADSLKLLHKNSPIYCITNGFDPDDFLPNRTKLTTKFTITYAGLLYRGKRDPALLFEVLSTLLQENRIDRSSLEVRFYGPYEDWLLNDARKYRLEDIVFAHGVVSREKALQKQKESQLLLLLLDKNNNEKNVYPAKLFEYFGAGRPIIALGGSDSAVKKLLDRTNTGHFLTEKNALKSILQKYYRQFVTSGSVSCNSNSEVTKFTYENIANQYSKILDYLVSDPKMISSNRTLREKSQWHFGQKA